jgi:N-acetylneuraminate synthase
MNSFFDMDALNSQTPYIIAEIGVNHEGSLSRAKALVQLAAEGGASAAKFQTYKASDLAVKASPAYWDLTAEPTQTQRELFAKYDLLSDAGYRELARHCSDFGIDFLSTPFSEEAVELLDPLVSAFKVASADITNFPLLRQIAKKRKPVMISTGASSEDEIKDAVKLLKTSGVSQLCVMHCVLSYPTHLKDANLGMIPRLASLFPDSRIGYSDHTVPDPELLALTTSYILGASVIETHFTDDKGLPGNDHYHALDKNDLIELRRRLDVLDLMKGQSATRKVFMCERQSRLHARRSIVATRQIRKGARLLPQDVGVKRPGAGLHPRYIEDLVGRTALRDIYEDEFLSWDDFAIALEA